jgi:hypothetical protein
MQAATYRRAAIIVLTGVGVHFGAMARAMWAKVSLEERRGDNSIVVVGKITKSDLVATPKEGEIRARFRAQ